MRNRRTSVYFCSGVEQKTQINIPNWKIALEWNIYFDMLIIAE